MSDDNKAVVSAQMSLACLAHVNFFAAHLLFDVITEQINDDDDDNNNFKNTNAWLPTQQEYTDLYICHCYVYCMNFIRFFVCHP